ncbi:hypothetical protein [Streptomyces sp. NPDC048157]|uniref:hypothetical protein n=1 Tax=Streptomyces sp. NPDC048157 TaxID=3365503 RepID=UPI00371E0659
MTGSDFAQCPPLWVGTDVGMGRHHIISLSRLKTFWNDLMDHGHERELDQLLAGIGQHLTRYQARTTDFTDADLCDFTAKWPTYSHDPGGTVPPGIPEIARFFCWLPANIFIGPASDNRTDDPGERFEADCARVLRPPEPGSKKEFQVREALSLAIDRYSKCKPSFQLAHAKAAVAELMNIYLRPGYWDFVRDEWVYNPNPLVPPKRPRPLFMIDQTRPVPTVAERLARPIDATTPNDIQIGTQTITPEVLDSDPEANETYARGRAPETVSLRDLLDWCEHEGYSVSLPPELEDVRAGGLVVEVSRSPGRLDTDLTLETGFAVAGTPVQALLTMRCTKIPNGDTDVYAVDLQVQAGVTVQSGGQPETIWFGGGIAKGSTGRWSLNASWGASGRGASALDVVRALGADVPEPSEWAQMIPSLTRVALAYDFTDSTLAVTLTASEAQLAFISIRS